MASAKFALVLIPMDPKQGYGSEDLISAIQKTPELLAVARVVSHPAAIAKPEILASVMVDEAKAGLAWIEKQITPERMAAMLGIKLPAPEEPK